MKPEYKKTFKDDHFGNNKVLTGRSYKPSFGMAEGVLTKVVGIPVRLIEKSIHIIANSGENKEKFDFF